MRLTFGLILAWALSSACSVGGDFIKPVTMEKAVYFHVDKGSLNGHGIQITGEGLTYHSAPCKGQECPQHSNIP